MIIGKLNPKIRYFAIMTRLRILAGLVLLALFAVSSLSSEKGELLIIFLDNLLLYSSKESRTRVLRIQKIE